MELKPWQKIGLSVLTVGVTITAIGLTISHIRKRMAANAQPNMDKGLSDHEIEAIAKKLAAKDPSDNPSQDLSNSKVVVKNMVLTSEQAKKFNEILDRPGKESDWTADDRLFMSNLFNRSNTNRRKEKDRLNTIDKHASSKLLKK